MIQRNAPETEGSEWCIATNHASTYVPVWDGNSNGADIWKAFAADGMLRESRPVAVQPNSRRRALCHGRTRSRRQCHGAFCAGLVFSADGVRFWNTLVGAGLPSGSHSLRNSLSTSAKRHCRIATSGSPRSMNGRRPIIQNGEHPEWVKQAALNELYYSTFGGSFWENGCITKPKQFGNRPGQHISFVMECQEYAFAESFDVRHHPARSNRDLWPQQERATLLLFRDFVMDSPDGSCPHDAGAITVIRFLLTTATAGTITRAHMASRGASPRHGLNFHPSSFSNAMPTGIRPKTMPF